MMLVMVLSVLRRGPLLWSALSSLYFVVLPRYWMVWLAITAYVAAVWLVDNSDTLGLALAIRRLRPPRA